ncbi:MAG TPA: WhiB family transcriptional regulator [Natronosporangium sp.]|nr:WhiB family transcriptional regulator [Natronosporangium sp.]
MSDWRAKAACRDHDPENWFPIGTSGPALAQTARAKAICRRCPVTRDCLAVALDRGEYGIWGGLTEDERRSLVRHMARRGSA